MTSRSGARSRPYARSFTLISAIVVSPFIASRRSSAFAETEVRFPDAGLLPQRGRGTVGDDAPLLEDVGAVGDLQRADDVLLDEQDGHALFVDRPDGLEHVVDHRRRQPEGRLVQ